MHFYWHSAANFSTQDNPAQTRAGKAEQQTENPH